MTGGNKPLLLVSAEDSETLWEIAFGVCTGQQSDRACVTDSGLSGASEHGKSHLNSLNCGEFFKQLNVLYFSELINLKSSLLPHCVTYNIRLYLLIDMKYYIKQDEITVWRLIISSIQRVEEFKYLGTTLRNQSSIQEEIKSRLKLGNACYYSMQNLLSSSLLSKNLKIKIYRTIILSVVLYGCETWSLTLREERRLRVFENRVLRRVFGSKRDEITGEWRKLHNEELRNLYSLPILCGW